VNLQRVPYLDEETPTFKGSDMGRGWREGSEGKERGGETRGRERDGQGSRPFMYPIRPCTRSCREWLHVTNSSRQQHIIAKCQSGSTVYDAWLIIPAAD